MAKSTWLLPLALLVCCGLPIIIIFIASSATGLAVLLYPSAALLISFVAVLIFSILIALLVFRRYHLGLNRYP